MRSVVSAKGQVTIPKALRDQLGIAEGQLLDFVEEEGKLVARKIFLEDPFVAAAGILHSEGSTDEIINQLRGEPDGV